MKQKNAIAPESPFLDLLNLSREATIPHPRNTKAPTYSVFNNRGKNVEKKKWNGNFGTCEIHL